MALLLVSLLSSNSGQLFAAKGSLEIQAIYAEEITEALAKPSMMEKIEAFNELIGERAELEAAGTERYNKTNQIKLHEALVTLFNQSVQKKSDIATMMALRGLLDTATKTTSSVLKDAHKLYITNQMLPRLKSNSGTPSKAALSVAKKPAQIHARLPQGGAITQPPTSPMPISSTMIQHALKRATLLEKVNNLHALLTLAQGFTFNDSIQNTFANGLASVFQAKPRPNNVAKKLKAVLLMATGSPLLTMAQRKHVKNNMLKKVRFKKKRAVKHRDRRRRKKVHRKKDQRLAQRNKKAVATINKALKQSGAKKQIRILIKLVRKTRKKDGFTGKTQDAFGQALVALFNNRGSYKPAEMHNLKKLLIKASKSPLLTTVQKNYVKKQMLGKLK